MMMSGSQGGSPVTMSNNDGCRRIPVLQEAEVMGTMQASASVGDWMHL